LVSNYTAFGGGLVVLAYHSRETILCALLKQKIFAITHAKKSSLQLIRFGEDMGFAFDVQRQKQ